MTKKKNKHSKTSWKVWSIILFVAFCISIPLTLFITRTMYHEEDCANAVSCISDLTGNYDESALTGEYRNTVIPVPTLITQSEPTQPSVLNAASSSNKRIEIDLSNQLLHAFENDREVFTFPISSGLWGRTPTGEFTIWIKLRYTRMKGGSKELGTYYDLPNVPHTMFFYNDKIPKWRGFGIHGAYWHNNFGHPMSHGCINMALPDVEQLYNWATPTSTAHTTHATSDNPGTKVIIYGTAPNY